MLWMQRKVPVGGPGPRGPRGPRAHIPLFLLHRGRRDVLGLGGVVLGPGGESDGASERAWQWEREGVHVLGQGL